MSTPPRLLTNRTGRGGRSPELRAAVVQAILSGSEHRDVARRYKVSTSSIWLWCKVAGVPKVKGLPPTCHPEAPVYARRLCRPCYMAEWNRTGFIDLTHYLSGKVA